jgi:transcriptional regulator with XRE-family HTH domain
MTKPKTLLEVFTGQVSDGTVGEYIRRLRRRKGWTLLELARETGLSYSHLSRLENDKNLPNPETVVTLAHSLDGDLDQMLLLAKCLPQALLDLLSPRSTVIELGHLPDPDLSPNKRLHYMELYKAKASAKQEAAALVMAQGKPARPYEQAHITITWVAKDKRRRDVDNLFASCKASIDGLVAVGLLADDDAMHVSYTLRYEQGTRDNTIIEVEKIG